jgi:hypothetical protein
MFKNTADSCNNAGGTVFKITPQRASEAGCHACCETSSRAAPLIGP